MKHPGARPVLNLIWALLSTACSAQDGPSTPPSVPVAQDPAQGSDGGPAQTGGNNQVGNPSDSTLPQGTGVALADRPTCSGLGTWDAQAAQFEAQVLVLVNTARAQGATCGSEHKPAVAALRADAKLDCISRSYAKTMSDNGFFSHTGLDGSSPFDRMRSVYPAFRGASENIASGQRTAEAVVGGWLKSSGHCQNMMGNYTVMGIGMYKNVWVQTFVRP